MIRFDTSGGQSFDRELDALYRRIDGKPKPLSRRFFLRFLQTLREYRDYRDALRGVMRESDPQ